MSKTFLFLFRKNPIHPLAWWGPFTLFLVACSLFETQPFYPVAYQTSLMNLAPVGGETDSFSYEEYFAYSPESNLADTLVASGTLNWLSLESKGHPAGGRYIRSAKTDGTLGLRLDTITVTSDDGGFLVMANSFFGGGYLPTLHGTDSASNKPWKILPPQMQSGDQWRWVKDNWVCTRQVLGHDTLGIHDTLFQAWEVSETLVESGVEVSHGRYWFNDRGLLKAEWEWPEVNLTDERAEDLGTMVFKRVLRREF